MPLVTDNYNAESNNKVLDTNISRLMVEDDIKHLLNCPKVDDDENYKSVSKKYMIIHDSQNAIVANEIFVYYYSPSLISCKGL